MQIQVSDSYWSFLRDWISHYTSAFIRVFLWLSKAETSTIRIAWPSLLHVSLNTSIKARVCIPVCKWALLLKGFRQMRQQIKHELSFILLCHFSIDLCAVTSKDTDSYSSTKRGSIPPLHVKGNLGPGRCNSQPKAKNSM